MPIKVLGSNGNGNISNLIKGINYAIDHNVQIVCLSLNLKQDREDLKNVILYAEAKNVLVVASTGNDGGKITYPAAYPTVLAVGGITNEKRVVSNSNRGKEVDLVAPWTVHIRSKDNHIFDSYGTSMAAAEVAGVAALARAIYPDKVSIQIRSLLKESAEDVENPGWDPLSGYGMIRADKVLNAKYSEKLFGEKDKDHMQ